MTKTLTKTTLAALALGLSVPAMAATDGTPGATSSGSFETSMTVTAPAQPTFEIRELDDFLLGTFAQGDLTTGSTSSSGDGQGYICVLANYTGDAPVGPKITFSQTGSFNSDIGTNFALVGPARSGTDSGFAQVPLEIRLFPPYNSPNGLSGEVAQRGVTVPYSVSYASTAVGCGSASVYGTFGATKPAILVKRLAAADRLNPAGNYSATIQVTVSPQ